MRKDISSLVALLERSMVEIAGSGADDRDALMHKSAGEFETALLETLDPILPADAGEPLQDGLNHIALFAHALTKLANDIDLIKSGQGALLVLNKSEADPELDENSADAMDRFLDIGVLTLRSLANDSAELPADDRDLQRAERAGILVKIQSYDGDDLLVKSYLPDSLRDYLTDPLELMGSMVEVGRSFIDSAIGLAEPMAKQNLIPTEIAEAYPELFEPDPLGKAGNPFAKKPAPGGPPAAAPAKPAAQGAAPEGMMQDEPVDDDGADTGEDPGDTAGDDATQNPIELMVRMASIIVVVGGSLLQGQGDQGQEDPTMQDQAAMPPARPPLQRSVPIEDVPLEKILRGEIVVSDSVAEALEEREEMRKAMAAMLTHKQASEETLRKMQETIDRLNNAPAVPKGVVFSVSKSGDVELPAQSTSMLAKTQRIEELAKSDPQAAAKEMLKLVHLSGGQPMIPPPG